MRCAIGCWPNDLMRRVFRRRNALPARRWEGVASAKFIGTRGSAGGLPSARSLVVEALQTHHSGEPPTVNLPCAVTFARGYPLCTLNCYEHTRGKTVR